MASVFFHAVVKLADQESLALVRPLAFFEIRLHFALPPPRAKGRANRIRQHGRMKRPFQHRDVAE